MGTFRVDERMQQKHIKESLHEKILLNNVSWKPELDEQLRK